MATSTDEFVSALWSPDSQRLLIARWDSREATNHAILELLPQDGSLVPLRQEIKGLAISGSENVQTCHLYSIDLATKEIVPVVHAWEGVCIRVRTRARARARDRSGLKGKGHNVSLFLNISSNQVSVLPPNSLTCKLNEHPVYGMSDVALNCAWARTPKHGRTCSGMTELRS